MIFSKFTKLYNYHHNPVLEHFYYPYEITHAHLMLIPIPRIIFLCVENGVSRHVSGSSEKWVSEITLECWSLSPNPTSFTKYWWVFFFFLTILKISCSSEKYDS